MPCSMLHARRSVMIDRRGFHSPIRLDLRGRRDMQGHPIRRARRDGKKVRTLPRWGFLLFPGVASPFEAVEICKSRDVFAKGIEKHEMRQIPPPERRGFAKKKRKRGKPKIRVPITLQSPGRATPTSCPPQRRLPPAPRRSEKSGDSAPPDSRPRRRRSPVAPRPSPSRCDTRGDV